MPSRAWTTATPTRVYNDANPHYGSRIVTHWRCRNAFHDGCPHRHQSIAWLCSLLDWLDGYARPVVGKSA